MFMKHENKPTYILSQQYHTNLQYSPVSRCSMMHLNNRLDIDGPRVLNNRLIWKFK